MGDLKKILTLTLAVFTLFSWPFTGSVKGGSLLSPTYRTAPLVSVVEQEGKLKVQRGRSEVDKVSRTFQQRHTLKYISKLMQAFLEEHGSRVSEEIVKHLLEEHLGRAHAEHFKIQELYKLGKTFYLPYYDAERNNSVSLATFRLMREMPNSSNMSDREIHIGSIVLGIRNPLSLTVSRDIATKSMVLPDRSVIEILKGPLIEVDVPGEGDQDALDEISFAFSKKIVGLYPLFHPASLGRVEDLFQELLLNVSMHGKGGKITLQMFRNSPGAINGIFFSAQDNGDGLKRSPNKLYSDSLTRKPEANSGAGFGVITRNSDKLWIEFEEMLWTKNNEYSRTGDPAFSRSSLPSKVREGTKITCLVDLPAVIIKTEVSPEKKGLSLWERAKMGETPNVKLQPKLRPNKIVEAINQKLVRDKFGKIYRLYAAQEQGAEESMYIVGISLLDFISGKVLIENTVSFVIRDNQIHDFSVDLERYKNRGLGAQIMSRLGDALPLGTMVHAQIVNDETREQIYQDYQIDENGIITHRTTGRKVSEHPLNREDEMSIDEVFMLTKMGQLFKHANLANFTLGKQSQRSSDKKRQLSLLRELLTERPPSGTVKKTNKIYGFLEKTNRSETQYAFDLKKPDSMPEDGREALRFITEIVFRNFEKTRPEKKGKFILGIDTSWIPELQRNSVMNNFLVNIEQTLGRKGLKNVFFVHAEGEKLLERIDAIRDRSPEDDYEMVIVANKENYEKGLFKRHSRNTFFTLVSNPEKIPSWGDIALLSIINETLSRISGGFDGNVWEIEIVAQGLISDIRKKHHVQLSVINQAL